MFILGNLLLTIAEILNFLCNALVILVFLRALISWVSPDPSNPIVQFLFQATEPLLEPIRKRLPQMRLDISPLVLILLIYVVQSFIGRTLMDMGLRLKY